MGGCTSKEAAHMQSLALESLRDWGVVQPKRAINVMEATAEELVKIQRRATKEYPFIASVYESVIITDALAADNPIVFVNDNFEKMTLYPREEVIGRNCRFLQGRFTDRSVVRRVREACEKGESLDVELLNYRKDGVPFWNRFLMLPIHKGKKVTHFLAVQKDVTFLRKADSHPRDWSAVEVALWLDSLKLSAAYADAFLAQGITGAALLQLDAAAIARLGVASEAHQAIIAGHLVRFRDGRRATLYPTLNEGILALPPPAYESLISGAGDAQLAVQPARLEQPFWATQQERHKVNELGIALKCTYNGTTSVLLVRANTTFAKLVQRIHSLFKGPFVLNILIEDDGDIVEIVNDQDLANAFALAHGNTLVVRLEDSLVKREDDSAADGDQGKSEIVVDRVQDVKKPKGKKHKERVAEAAA